MGRVDKQQKASCMREDPGTGVRGLEGQRAEVSGVLEGKASEAEGRADAKSHRQDIPRIHSRKCWCLWPTVLIPHPSPTDKHRWEHSPFRVPPFKPLFLSCSIQCRWMVSVWLRRVPGSLWFSPDSSQEAIASSDQWRTSSDPSWSSRVSSVCLPGSLSRALASRGLDSILIQLCIKRGWRHTPPVNRGLRRCSESRLA